MPDIVYKTFRWYNLPKRESLFLTGRLVWGDHILSLWGTELGHSVRKTQCTSARAFAFDGQSGGSSFPQPWEIVGDPSLSFRGPPAQQSSFLFHRASKWAKMSYGGDLDICLIWACSSDGYLLSQYHNVQIDFILNFGSFGSSSPLPVGSLTCGPHAVPEISKWPLGKTGSSLKTSISSVLS